MKKTRAALQLHLRICTPAGPLFGPGKRQLLASIAETRSIAVAARSMDMSYMRAWKLVQAMNREWRQPLVEMTRGGHQRGGATVTATGQAVLRLYDEIATESRRATRTQVRQLLRLR